MPGILAVGDGCIVLDPRELVDGDASLDVLVGATVLHIIGPIKQEHADHFYRVLSAISKTLDTVAFMANQHEENGILHDYFRSLFQDAGSTKIKTIQLGYLGSIDSRRIRLADVNVIPKWVGRVVLLPHSTISAIHFLDMVGIMDTRILFGEYGPPKEEVRGVRGERPLIEKGIHQLSKRTITVVFSDCNILNFDKILIDWHTRPGAVRVISVSPDAPASKKHEDAEVYLIGAGLPVRMDSVFSYKLFSQTNKRRSVFIDMNRLDDAGCKALLVKSTQGAQYEDIVIFRSDHTQPSQGVLNGLYAISRPYDGSNKWGIFSLSIINQPAYDVQSLADMLRVKQDEPMIWISSLTIGQSGIHNVHALLTSMRAAKTTVKIRFATVKWIDNVYPSSLLEYACDEESALRSVIVRGTNLGSLCWAFCSVRRPATFAVNVLDVPIEMSLGNMASIGAAIRSSKRLTKLSLMFDQPPPDMRERWDENLSKILVAVANSQLTHLLLPRMRHWEDDAGSAEKAYRRLAAANLIGKIKSGIADYPSGIVGIFVALSAPRMKTARIVGHGAHGEPAHIDLLPIVLDVR